MIPDWLSALFRTNFTSRRSRPAARPARSRALLRLEGLEDRALLTMVTVEAPAWWSAVVADTTTEETRVVTVSDPDAEGGTRELTVRFGGAGLVWLLDDLGVVATLSIGAAPSNMPATSPPGVSGDFTGAGATPSPPPASATHVVLNLPAHWTGSAQRLEETPAPPKPGRADSVPHGEVAPPVPPAPGVPSVPPASRPVAQSSGAWGPPGGGGLPVSPSAPGGVVASLPIPQTVYCDAVRGASAVGTAVSPPLQNTPDANGAGADLPTPRPAHGGPTDRPASSADARPGLGALTDGVLVRRYAADREQAAFTELVRRHGRTVLTVCTRVLGDADRAQDASQATFLALARRAEWLDGRGSLAGWLYKVAYRMALRLRSAAARQRRVEQAAAERRPWGEEDDFAGIDEADVWRVLREELQRLPEKYREPLVLCYFDGRTHAELAEAIGLPRGSVAKRLGEAMERLRERLAARGFRFEPDAA